MNTNHVTNNNGDYVAWLVEWRNSPGGLRYLALDELLNIRWVRDADDAVHFARKADAERVIGDGGIDMDIVAVSHEWCGGTPKPPVVPPIDWEAQ